MSNFHNQQQTPVSYPPPGEAYPTSQYDTAPPPMGYPSKDGSEEQRIPDQTTSRGDGFWKGCCAAICCCCAIDICF
ncbi:unnamed protein product [Lathyrus oleraceus]